MTLSAAQLNDSSEDIGAILDAFRSGDGSHVSAVGHSLVYELTNLDDAGWDDLLEKVEDDELREQVDAIRQILKEKVVRPIRKVQHSVSFDVSRPSLAVNLILIAGGETLTTRADLEDTLWAGSAIVRVVRETMQSMNDTLNLPTQRACIGSNFEENLVRAEAAIAEIRQLYEAARKAGALD